MIFGKNQRGQFIAEFALSLVIWTALFAGLIGVVRLALVRQRAHALARFGAFLFATGRVNESDVLEEQAGYARAFTTPKNVQWSFQLSRYQAIAASRFYHLIESRVQADHSQFPQPVVDHVVVQQEDPSL